MIGAVERHLRRLIPHQRRHRRRETGEAIDEVRLPDVDIVGPAIMAEVPDRLHPGCSAGMQHRQEARPVERPGVGLDEVPAHPVANRPRCRARASRGSPRRRTRHGRSPSIRSSRRPSCRRWVEHSNPPMKKLSKSSGLCIARFSALNRRRPERLRHGPSPFIRAMPRAPRVDDRCSVFSDSAMRLNRASA